MIGAPPAQDEQAGLSGARGDFVATLPRRLEVLRGALKAVEDLTHDSGRINGLLRRLHALGSAARVLGFASVAEALGEAERNLRRVARSGPTPTELADIARALDLLPSLVLGAKVSIPAVAPHEAVAATGDFPLSVLILGPPALADVLTQQAGLRVECERTGELAKARELSRLFGPDVALIDADREGARELVELFVKDPLVEPIPIVVVGDFASPELSASFTALGATRVLRKPVSPDTLRRTLLELRSHASPAIQTREPLGELNVSQLVDRIALEIRRGLVEAVEPAARSSSVGFGEGTDVMSAVWGTVARLRELVTLRSEGNVRFEQTGPEGAVPLAPWNDDRRLGERGGREGRAGEGVALRGRRVVVVDDDPAVVWFLSGILKAVGAEVFEAHDGERAFELTASLWPDLVVSDVLMPKLDGFSLCHQIKRDVAVRDVPVILLSWKEDLLQRVRELGGDADGYLRKEAAASTVVERLREVLRPRARVEKRVENGGEVRGRLDGLTPRLILELACRAQRDVRVSIRDSYYLYEIQVRAGAPRTATRSASDGSSERGEGVLSALLGVSAGRFVIEPDPSACRAELVGSLYEQLAGPVARARAAQRALSAGALASVTRVAFDATRVGGYVSCTPEPAQSLLRELLSGASPRDLLTSGRAPARLLEAVLSDFARRGAILLVETAGGVEDISQTRVPPPVAADQEAAPPPAAVPHVNMLAADPPAVAAPESSLRAPPAPPRPEDRSRRTSEQKPPAVYSRPPDAELASADAGWFSLEIEASAEPPEAALVHEAAAAVEAAASDVAVPLPRGLDPLRQTLASSAPPPEAGDQLLPGASIPLARGHRPQLRADTLDSAGTEAVAAQAAVTSADVSVSTPVPSVIDDDPLAQALLVDTRPPLDVVALRGALASAASPPQHERAPAVLPPASDAAQPGVEGVRASESGPHERHSRFGQTLPLSAVKLSAGSDAKRADPKRSGDSTQPPQVAPRKSGSKAKVRAATQAPTAPVPPNKEGGNWLWTGLFALLAAGGSYFGVYGVTILLRDPAPGPTEVASSVVTPVPTAVLSRALATLAPKLQVTTSDSPLAPGADVPAGSGLLEVQVPDGTAIRVDGEYLGMGPGRRVPLTPGVHSLRLGEGAPQMVTIKPGERTLAVVIAPQPAPAGSP